MRVLALRFFWGGAEKKKGKGKTKMRFMKRIAAIMLSVVMVLGMSSAVSATNATSQENPGTSTTTRGKITIDNAIVGQTYTIYRILELESYSHDGVTPKNGNYAYKVAPGWENFVDASGDGSAYLEKDASGYVTWKGDVTDARLAEFAKEALAYATSATPAIPNAGRKEAPAATTGSDTTTVEFDNLTLGYYLVESSTGALCSLTTTNNQVNIREKNGVPSVEKKVQEDSKTAGAADEYGDTNTADIGQTVHFKTTITAQAGAKNYVLHDKMSDGLTFDSGSVVVKWTNSDGTEKATAPVTPADYSVITDSLESVTPCTFHIEFTEAFCVKLEKDDKIIVTYSATLNKKASIGTTPGNTNETWLGYGNNSTTNHDTTTTKTFELPVFKYTEKTAGMKIGLAGAKFKLSTSADPADSSKIVKMEQITGGVTEDTYCVNNKAGTVEEITTTDRTTESAGKFKIKGLDAGTYYLHETKQPDGYNKLTAPVTVVIAEDGTITVNNAALPTPGLVEIENKTGSLLPSTGGRGTTILYVLGALLVLGSSVVLITKRRTKE